MANTHKRNSTVKHSDLSKVEYQRWGYNPWVKRKRDFNAFIGDETSRAETIAQVRALGTKTGQKAIEYGGIAKEKATTAKNYAVIEGKLAAGKAKYYGEEVGEVGAKVAESGIKTGKWYTEKLPKKLVDSAATFSEKEPDYKGMEGKINWGLGFGAKAAKVFVKETRDTRVGRAASKVTGKAQATYAKGMNVGGKLDVIGSRFTKRFAPDSVAKSGIKLGKGIHEYAAWETKTGEKITHSKYGQAYRKNVNVGKKYIGEKSEKIKGSKFGKFVGGSEAAGKYREAKGKLSYARQHKMGASLKIGKMGAKGTAKFALANANFASNLIAQQDGVLAVLKPIFWSLKLVPFVTSAIMPILIVVIVALIGLMLLTCGWISLGYLLYALKSVPCIMWNLFATLINAMFYSFHGVTQLLIMGIQDIINAVAFFFAKPVIDFVNFIGQIVYNINPANWVDITQKALAGEPTAYVPIEFKPFGNTSWAPTPTTGIVYSAPDPILFNTDRTSVFYGWPILGSIFSISWVKPGTPLYVTDSHGAIDFYLMETGSDVKIFYAPINPDARANGWPITTLDHPPNSITNFFDPGAHLTFADLGSKVAEELYKNVGDKLISITDYYNMVPKGFTDSLGNAAAQNNMWGNKVAIYDRDGVRWAYAPEDLGRRVNESNPYRYYLAGKGPCIVYYTGTSWDRLKGNIPQVMDFFATLTFAQKSDIRNITEGISYGRPDIIFGGEPFYVDQAMMKILKLGRYAEQGDVRSRLWEIHYNGQIWRDPDTGGSLVLPSQFDKYYLMSLQKIVTIDYTNPGG